MFTAGGGEGFLECGAEEFINLIIEGGGNDLGEFVTFQILMELINESPAQDLHCGKKIRGKTLGDNLGDGAEVFVEKNLQAAVHEISQVFLEALTFNGVAYIPGGEQVRADHLADIFG